jgi:ADP-ribosylglycohydrolase
MARLMARRNLPPHPLAPIAASLCAGALGDALGGAAEGRAAGQSPGPGPLRISDDTQLTLATCASLVESGGVDPERLAARFADDHQRGRYRGLGASTAKALLDLASGAHWSQSGRRGERAAGNGAAMR